MRRTGMTYYTADFDKIMALAWKKGMTQNQFGVAIGKTQSYFSAMKAKGGKIPENVMTIISLVLNVPIDDLIINETPTHNSSDIAKRIASIEKKIDHIDENINAIFEKLNRITVRQAELDVKLNRFFENTESKTEVKPDIESQKKRTYKNAVELLEDVVTKDGKRVLEIDRLAEESKISKTELITAKKQLGIKTKFKVDDTGTKQVWVTADA